jgi:ribosome-binding protein aMBF1 (putative translation factor)
METLGQIVKRLREKRSQDWLSERIGKSQMWVSRIESGATGCTVDEWATLCTHLGATDEDRAAGVRAIALRAAESAGLTMDDLRDVVGAA